MMTRGGEGGKKCRKFDDVICERPLITPMAMAVLGDSYDSILPKISYCLLITSSGMHAK